MRCDCLDTDDADDMCSWDHHGGFSLDASVHIDEHDHYVVVKMAPWDGEYDGVQGLVERVHAYPNTLVEIWAVGVRVIVTGETKP